MAAFDSIEQARALQFRANVIHLYQQKGSKLRDRTRVEPLLGKAHFFERLSSEAAVVKSSRHADTVLLDPVHSRRMVVPLDYVWNALTDQQDKVRTLINPESEYAIAAANALQRAYDVAVITAFAADAKGGEDGSTAVTFASDQAGDADPSAGAVDTGDVLNAQKALDNNEVPDDDRYALVRPSFVSQLLANSTAPIAASSDYNSVKALVMGELNTWVGFTWIKSTLLPLAAGTDYYNFFWQKNAMGVAINKDIMARVSERPDKDYSVQAYACLTMGATRVQGTGVYRIRHDDGIAI